MFAVYGDSNGDGVRMNMRMRMRVKVRMRVRMMVGMTMRVIMFARAFSIFRCHGPKVAHEMSPDCFDFLRSL